MSQMTPCLGSMRKHILAVLPALVLFFATTSVSADFGDYVDPTFSCPATTTCPTVCVASLEDCPTMCGGNRTQLCPNGECRDPSEKCPSSAQNPCPKCLPIACAKIISSFDTCESDYEPYYQAESECRLQLEEQITHVFHEKEDIIKAIFGTWVALVTLATMAWTWNNQHTTTLYLEKNSTQTGYKQTTVGRCLYYAVGATLVGFQLVLLILAVASYKQERQKEALAHFEVVWCVAFVWTLVYKWPQHSIQSVFYKACDLNSATHVCVFTNYKNHNFGEDNENQPLAAAALGKATSPTNIFATNPPRIKEPTYITSLRACLGCLFRLGNAALQCFFRMPSTLQGRMQYVPIQEQWRVDRTQPSQQTALPTRYIVHEFRRYNFSSEKGKFVPGDISVAETVTSIASGSKGLTAQQAVDRLSLCGPNLIEMPQPFLGTCIADEFSKTFYVYQLFMLFTWMPLNYYYMAIVHACVIISGGVTLAFFRFRNESNLFKLTVQEGDAQALRDGKLIYVPQESLVPGDIIVVEPGLTYSDMILISMEGTVVVDESALTGEATPMAKTPMDLKGSVKHRRYSPVTHKRNTIAAGTTVMESESEKNLAMVVNTGSFTSKGELLRGVFAYQRHQFQFDREVGVVLALLFLEAVIMFSLIVFFLNDDAVYAWFYGMYVVAAVLPPLLPTVFTVSVGVSDNRLTEKNISCSNSEDILVAGKVTKAFFDKTGTLTRQGLDYISAKCTGTWETESTDYSPDLVTGMSCCHGLTLSSEGMLIGNPVDTIMFQASGAQMTKLTSDSFTIVDKSGGNIQVVKHFDFDHDRMAQSVIVRLPDSSLVAFVKGSGESIKRMCIDGIPNDYDDVVTGSAKAGTYQISMAMKKVASEADVQSISRDDVERDLSFVGVINFKNVLREETPDVIHHLQDGEVDCIMVTGDNVHTGIRIAQEAGIIKEGSPVYLCDRMDETDSFIFVDENDQVVNLPPLDHLVTGNAGVDLAVTGEMWEKMLELEPDEANAVVHSIRVFGRCTPIHKVSVVATFVNHGYITMMCGDGGNDCGALKTAHVGIALSDAEASIVSPFTSLDKSIESVVEVLKEGRCALASALASYKYVIMYGQIEAVSNVFNAYYRINFYEYCWLFLDGLWVIGMSFSLPLAQAAKRLAPTRPTSSVLGPLTMASVVGILFINVSFAFLSLAALKNQDWYKCRQWENEDVSNLIVIGDNYEAQTLFLVLGYQMISTAMAYNFGYEFRAGWFQNKVLVGLVCFFTLIHVYVILVPGRLSCIWRVNCENDNVLYSFSSGRVLPIQNPFHTTLMPEEFRWTLLTLIAVNTVLNICWDYFAVNGWRKRMARRKRERGVQFSVDPNIESFETV